jgi:hypothetical protein
MMHAYRHWCVGTVDDPELLAEWLTQRSWTLCTGFAIGGYLFLNDATGEDGAQEYAVVKKPVGPNEPYLQVESITMSWCAREKALGYIRSALAGEMDRHDFAFAVTPHLETPQEHGRCHCCA